MLVAAKDEAGSVDVVILPESGIDETDIEGLEAVLDHHGVIYLQTGVRQRVPEPGRHPRNWVHTGVNPMLEKGVPPPSSREWFHIPQNKHHRWSLDEGQIHQYHLGGRLYPHIRWWEAMEVPRRSVQLVEVAELTIVTLVCEDLAQNDDVAELIRSVGPTLVVTVLLDGPQLTSRWSARYASVLADDPGSAVLTLTSYGMVQRSRPRGRDASPVIALWKDPARGSREISLEPGAQGVLLTVCIDRATRRSADGRWPVDNGTHAFDVAVQQVRAASAGSGSRGPVSATPAPRALEVDELTILTGWAEALAEALAHAPERAETLLNEASGGSPWRPSLGIPEPSPRLSEAIELVAEAVSAATPPGGVPTFDGLLAKAREGRADEEPLAALVRRVLRATLEQLRTRLAKDPSPA
jgi:hypothetical protein